MRTSDYPKEPFTAPPALTLLDYKGRKVGVLAELALNQRYPDPIWGLGTGGFMQHPAHTKPDTELRIQRLMISERWVRGLKADIKWFREIGEKAEAAEMESDGWAGGAPFSIGPTDAAHPTELEGLLLLPTSFNYTVTTNGDMRIIEDVKFLGLRLPEAIRMSTGNPRMAHAVKRFTDALLPRRPSLDETMHEDI
jgi:hypothetical protein